MAPRSATLVLGLAVFLVGCSALLPVPGAPFAESQLASRAPDAARESAAMERPAASEDMALRNVRPSVGEPGRRTEAQAAQAPGVAGRTAPRSDQVAPSPVPTAGPQPRVDESAVQLPIGQNLGRMVIYTTHLTILADDLDAFPALVGTIALAHGGYVAGVETKDEGGVPSITVQLKVPPERYEAAMRALRSLAVEVRDEKATTRDVTEEYSDVSSQIASLEATHAQLLRLIERAGSMEEVLKVQQEANRVKLQIDHLKGRQTALERLSELATITVKAQLASAALQRDYTAVRASLRRAEATRSALETQLKRARTLEEEATLRDKLGEAVLEIARLQGRLSDLETKAASARVTLPVAEMAAIPGRLDETLPRDYIDTRVALRRARHEQAELSRAIRAGRVDADPKALSEAVLKVHRLGAQLQEIQERATQLGIALPALTPEEEAVLAGVAPIAPGGFEVPAPIRGAWEASMNFLLAVASVLVFAWWMLPAAAVAFYLARRRSAPSPAPTG